MKFFYTLPIIYVLLIFHVCSSTQSDESQKIIDQKRYSVEEAQFCLGYLMRNTIPFSTSSPVLDEKSKKRELLCQNVIQQFFETIEQKK